MLFCLIALSTLSGEVFLVGIAGGSGSGKTTFANEIVKNFGSGALLVQADSYYKDYSYLPDVERSEVNFDHPNSIDIDLLVADLAALKAGREVDVPVYDFVRNTRSEKVQSSGHPKVVILDGIMVFALPEIREMIDLKIYLDTPQDLALLRRVERDILERGRELKSIQEKYLTQVRPMYKLFVKPSKQFADVIFLGDEDTTKSIDLVVSWIKLTASP